MREKEHERWGVQIEVRKNQRVHIGHQGEQLCRLRYNLRDIVGLVRHVQT